MHQNEKEAFVPITFPCRKWGWSSMRLLEKQMR